MKDRNEILFGIKKRLYAEAGNYFRLVNAILLKARDGISSNKCASNPTRRHGSELEDKCGGGWRFLYGILNPYMRRHGGAHGEKFQLQPYMNERYVE